MGTSESNTTRVHGSVDARFERVRDVFAGLASSSLDWDAQLCLYWKGECVVDLSTTDRDWITGVFSSTKGVAAVAVSTLIRDHQLDLERRVADYWPEFAAEGKADVTVGTLLSHQAGLVGVDGGFEPDDVLHSGRGAARLAASRPQWVPGSAFGYHGITIGIFMDELVRRIAKTTLHRLYEETVRRPADIDFYIGLPEEQDSRYRDILPPKAQGAPPAPGFGEDSITALMFNTIGRGPFSPHKDALSPNHQRVRAIGPTAVGGVGSARGLAQVYAAALGMAGSALLDRRTIDLVSQQRAWGQDRTLGVTNAFAMVFMKSTPRVDLGSYRAFGHDGAGGAIAYADPLHDLAVGYVPFPMRASQDDAAYRQLRTAFTQCVM